MKSSCPPDDELLALATDEPGQDELRGHVEQCPDCRMRVQLLRGEIAELRSLSGAGLKALAETVVPESDGQCLPSGASIGRYAIVGDLGSGGQADVYHVIDTDLRRDLVLKISKQKSAADNARRDALLAEGRLLAALDHPGLVRIFDAGIFEGRPYLVLDRVPGLNLEQQFGVNRPTARQAAHLIAEVARVVAYAHRRAAVHGDITPRNILIDGSGRPRLIDFGLARIEDAWGASGGSRGGTPGFLPPEVANGMALPASSGQSGDVFGLGATLYWLLTGQAPFTANTAHESLARARACEIDFEPFVRGHVPRQIALVCRQTLAADPDKRPTTDALATALERAARPWISRRVAAGVVAAAIAICGFALLWIEFHEVTTPPATVVHSVPSITVNGNFNLSNVLPLHSGDRISITCDISQGEQVSMLWLNAAGELRTFEPARDIAEKIDRMVYPAPGEQITLAAPEGTEMIFFCRGESVSADLLRACFHLGQPLAVLPKENYLELRRSEVTVRGPLAKAVTPGEIHQLATEMKDINRRLLQHFDGVTGIAFAHESAVRGVE